MNKYENGKIYKLTGSNGLVYYGSTIQPLNRRLTTHQGKSNTCISKLICDVKIELLENYPCDCRRELNMRERWYVENNECINVKIPSITKEEKKEYKKQYAINNKEKDKERNKQYRLINKEYNKQRYAYKTSHIGIIAQCYF